jgi:hypothetical protein
VISTAGYQVGGQERGLKGGEGEVGGIHALCSFQGNEAGVVESWKKKGEEEEWEETTRRKREKSKNQKHLAARTRHKTWKNPPCASAKSQVRREINKKACDDQVSDWAPG